MTGWDGFARNANSKGVLIDTNLFVLFVVGSVNPRRIPPFKRTQAYSPGDYAILIELLNRIPKWYAVPHLLAEVSKLTDLKGPELVKATDASLVQ